MCPDTSIPCSPCQAFICLHDDVLICPTVSELFSETKINQMDVVRFAPHTHQKIVWLDVSVDIPSRMHVFNSWNDLVGYQQHCFKWEHLVLFWEQLFQTWSKTLHNHGCVRLLVGTDTVCFRYTIAIIKQFVQSVFLLYLRVLWVICFQFDCYFITLFVLTLHD